MPYRIVFERSAAKSLKAIDQPDRQRIVAALQDLALDPFSSAHDVKRLQGRSGYRLRVGRWRVLYLLERTELLVVVVDIADRKDAYR